MYTIKNDRLYLDGKQVPFKSTPHQGGRIMPTCIVLHDTADRPTKFEDTINWFMNREAKVSAHLVLGRDGQVTQMVSFDRRAWHAGKSSFMGRADVNGFGIGIELDNPSKLTGTISRAKAYYGDWYGAEYGLKEVTTKAHGKGIWMPYTKAQIEHTIAICRALVAAYPSITHITTHWEISPGRKIDPNPLFPLAEVRAAVFDTPRKVWPLRIGSQNDYVRDVQERLLVQGYSMVKRADGIFGSQTRAGVLAWQAENGLPTNGELTWEEYQKLASPSSKRMITGPATAKAEAAQAGASKAAQVVVSSAATAIAADTVAGAVSDTSLWGMLMEYLGMAGDVVSKLNVLGVQIDPKILVSVLGIIGLLLLWRWIRMARTK